MLSKKTKIKILVAAALGCVGIAAIVMFLIFEKPSDDIAQLNSKYGLVTAESLGNSIPPRVANLFKPDSLSANLLDSTKPKKELIVKLAAQNSDSQTALQNVFILSLKTKDNIENIAREYANSPEVEYAEPNFDLEKDLSPTAATETKAVSIITDSDKKPVIVAVLDSGVDINHPDLEKRVVAGWNFLDDSADVADANGHGTHVAGIILRNSTAAEILPLKISDGSNGTLRELVEAIKYAADNNAQVINLSLGLKQESQVLREALDYAREKNVFVVAAAGNYRSSAKYFPAAYADVFAVSALANDGSKLFLSNFGEWVDFSVIAQDVEAPAPDEKYAIRTGTSQAAPVVTAKIADFLSTVDSANFDTVNEFLIKNSKQISGKYLLGRQILAVDK
ncbi:MAG: S8 family serine peptidase [Candidatus Gracilibacteria bacterium]